MLIIRIFMIALMSAAAVSPAAAEVNNPDKMVCKSTTKAGTRVPARKCMTAGEWDALAEQAKRDAAESFNRSNRPWQGDSDATKPGEGMGGPY